MPTASLTPNRVQETVTNRTLVVSVLHGRNEMAHCNRSSTSPLLTNAGRSLHTDAAQTVGKVPVNVLELGVDLLTVAGNKFYAPKGAGALYVRRSIELESLIHGGGHERGLRAGTRARHLPWRWAESQSWLRNGSPAPQKPGSASCR